MGFTASPGRLVFLSCSGISCTRRKNLRWRWASKPCNLALFKYRRHGTRVYDLELWAFFVKKSSRPLRFNDSKTQWTDFYPEELMILAGTLYAHVLWSSHLRIQHLRCCRGIKHWHNLSHSIAHHISIIVIYFCLVISPFQVNLGLSLHKPHYCGPSRTTKDKDYI